MSWPCHCLRKWGHSFAKDVPRGFPQKGQGVCPYLRGHGRPPCSTHTFAQEGGQPVGTCSSAAAIIGLLARMSSRTRLSSASARLSIEE
jgi:hypothetical protein